MHESSHVCKQMWHSNVIEIFRLGIIGLSVADNKRPNTGHLKSDCVTWDLQRRRLPALQVAVSGNVLRNICMRLCLSPEHRALSVLSDRNKIQIPKLLQQKSLDFGDRFHLPMYWCQYCCLYEIPSISLCLLQDWIPIQCSYPIANFMRSQVR
jgi:hypothetical protein